MFTPTQGAWRIALLCLVLVGSAADSAHAHLHWTRTNSVSPETVALYAFSDTAGSTAPPVHPLTHDLSLTPLSGSPVLHASGDTAGSIFAPMALRLPESQTLRSTATLTNLAGHLTIECWFKWEPAMTTSTLEVGLQSGARIQLARDIAFPANDAFRIVGTHGSFAPAPGFTSWQDLGDEEAGLNEWRHLALTIHSTGIHHDPLVAHDVYSTGTTGRIYYNGHLVGSYPHTIDLSGLKVHDSSRVTVIMRGGGVTIDELAVWRQDWSDNGINTNPFADGRGPESAVQRWRYYEVSP